MTMRSTPPFRADHVGSLLRPPELLAARDDHAAGRIDAARLRAVEDAAVADAVALQREVGLRSVTDGELRRGSWHMDFIYQLDGISRGDEQLCLSPQCGFSSTVDGNALTVDEQRAKLRLVVETAEEIWG